MTSDNRKRNSDESETEYQEPKRARANNAAAMDAHEESYTLSDGLKKYFDDPRFTDFSIKTRGRVFSVHKVITCSQSGYFSDRFTGLFGFLPDNVADFSHEDTSTVEAMVKFMYGIDYDGQGSTNGVDRDYNSDREDDSEEDDESSDDGHGAEIGDYDSPPLFHA